MNEPDGGSDQPRRGMGGIALRGAAVTMGGQVLKIVLQFGGLIIVARLLSPTDYGLMAMVMAIVGVGEVLREFGLSSASVQAKTVTQQQRSNLFWMNAGIGLLLTVLVLMGAPWIARWYDTPALLGVAQAVSATFLINGLATQYRAQLNREMRFGAMAAIEVSGQAVGLALGIALALDGQGYWALVAQQLGQAAVMLALLVAIGRWLPGLPRRCEGMGAFIGYGGNLMLAQLIGYFSRNVDAVVIGQRFGAEALGHYNRAFQFVMSPLTQINGPAGTVALPVLSRLREDAGRYREFLLYGQSALLHALFAGLAFVCAQADLLVTGVLGAKWAPMVPFFQILAIGGMFQAASYASYWAFLSLGLTQSNLRFALVSRPVFIVCILAGAWWGVLGVAIGHTLGLALNWLGALWWLRRSEAPVRKMLGNASLLLAAYGVCAAVSFLAPRLLHLSGWAGAGAGAAAMLVAFGLLCLILPPFRRSVMSLGRLRALARSSRTLPASNGTPNK
ncbi:lipopolysaccharide biosynthesis protein [Uliginosibacterium sp. H1]|uniref:lipopolysaccharide biosynthesis protein n=1 Tax=Uliginosibacterium sp. H1 TaxID=3114757 RepID=UPI002E198A93|nr:lipopolysaccharide biosynthesis protein [Uliginosibacterium sp. H1]